MVTASGRVVLLDFGLVRSFDPGVEPQKEAYFLGTPAYMAPEQAVHRVAVPASDWYAVGTMLYECLTGRLPFEGGAFDMMVQKQRADVRAPSALVTNVPEDLEALCLELLQRRPEARPSGEEVLRRVSQRSRSSLAPRSHHLTPNARTPFVGREAELAGLEAALADVHTGKPRTVIVRGGSGMGKSALVAAFLERARRGGALVLSGRCYERESVPFKAFDAVVDAMSHHLAALEPEACAAVLPIGVSDLARVFPVLRTMPALDMPASSQFGDALAQRRRAFTAMRELLGALARQAPLVVHVDDLQWGDADSAELLAEVMAPPDAPPMLLLATQRTGVGEGPLLEALGASARGRELLQAASVVAVGELSEAAAIELATRLGGADLASEELARTIAREAGGSPLFVAELVRHARARAARGDVTEAGPASLDEAILGRVADLAGETRRLLEVLSVAGRPLARDVALVAAGIEGDDRGAIVTLRAARMVNTRALGSRDEVEPFHDRIREAVVQSLAPEVVRATHAALASALRAAGQSDPDTLLEHVLGAGDRAGACELAILAADAAAQNLAFRRAARLYGTALELGAADGDGGLHRRQGDALTNAGLGALAAAAYREAARRAPDRETSIELRRLAAEHLLKTGHDAEGLAALREVLDDVGLSYPGSTRGAITSLLFHRARLRLSGLEFVERPAHEVPDADRARIDVAYSAAVGLSLLDTLRSADYIARALALALKAGEPVRLCRALALEASMTASAGHGARARALELVAVAEKISYRVGDPHIVAFARLGRAYVSMLMGDWREAQTRCAELEIILRERCHGVFWEIANTQIWTCNSLILSGEIAAAVQRARSVLREAYERGDRYTTMHIVYPVTVGHITDDRADDGRRFVAELMREWTLDRYSAGHWGALVSGLSLDRYEGKGGAAWALAEQQYPALEKTFLLRIQIVRTFARFEHGLTAVAAASETRDRSALLAAADRDARAIRKEGTPYAVAMGAHVAGLAAFARGDERAAADLLRAASDGLDAAGMKYLAACARHRLGELLSGDEGAALEDAAAAYLRGQGIARPERCVAMSAPGAFR